MKKHKCSWATVDWEFHKGVPYYHIGGLGETLERNGKCRECGKNFREIYLQSCTMDDDTDEVISL